jgi:hypothetical protein
MVLRVFLFQHGEHSREQVPQWWRNFVHATLPRGHVLTPTQSQDALNHALMHWHAQYWYHGVPNQPTHRYIDFYDSAAYTWFLLHWTNTCNRAIYN